MTFSSSLTIILLLFLCPPPPQTVFFLFHVTALFPSPPPPHSFSLALSPKLDASLSTYILPSCFILALPLISTSIALISPSLFLFALAHLAYSSLLLILCCLRSLSTAYPAVQLVFLIFPPHSFFSSPFSSTPIFMLH